MQGFFKKPLFHCQPSSPLSPISFSDSGVAGRPIDSEHGDKIESESVTSGRKETELQAGAGGGIPGEKKGDPCRIVCCYAGHLLRQASCSLSPEGGTRGQVERIDMASSSRSSSSQFGGKCHYFCGVPAVVLTSHTHKNSGRRFLRCSHYKDMSRRCGFFRWLDDTRVFSEAESLTDKPRELDSEYEIIIEKQDGMVGGIGDLVRCVSLLNQEVRGLKKEVQRLKEADRRCGLELFYIKRNQVIMTTMFCIIIAIVCYTVM